MYPYTNESIRSIWTTDQRLPEAPVLLICHHPFVLATLRRKTFAINNFREWSTFANIIIANFYVRKSIIYIHGLEYIRTIILPGCHIKMADIDESSLFGGALLLVNAIIERRTRTKKEQEI